MRPAPVARLATPLAALLALAGCDKFQYLPDNPVPPITPIVIMHKGNGNETNFHNNTLDAVLYGCSRLDGAEMDLQLSADGTLWLGHDNELLDCTGASAGACFQDATDAEIASVATCPDGTHYNTLEEVLTGVKAAYPQKVFSMDVKGQYCTLRDARADAEKMAEQLNDLLRDTRFAGLVVITESDQDAFLQRIRDLAVPVHSLVVALTDIDGPLSQAAALGAAGISFGASKAGAEPLTASVVAGIHQKGFRIAVWTIDGQAYGQEVYATQPDVIQTDDGNFYSYLTAVPDPIVP